MLRSTIESLDRSLTIDMSGIRFIDEAALQVIRDSVSRGSKVVGASTYLSMRLGLSENLK
ncbi:MAG: hypothetical protein DHS20C01_08800 [marine bacterium B5-7]|nr:MAG: hypothetical protein DHS20C01_08800 [marine bacterium B5-7]